MTPSLLCLAYRRSTQVKVGLGAVGAVRAQEMEIEVLRVMMVEVLSPVKAG